MPHKHKRKADADDKDVWNLPPTQRATPLPVGKGRAPNPAPKKRKISGNQYGADDTPKAFARLMAFKAKGKGPKGLDDGPRTKKQQKAAAQNGREGGKGKANDTGKEEAQENTPNSESQSQPQQPAAAPALPKIMPGEKLSDFAQRVNQALPLTGIGRSGKKIDGISDHRVTRHEKKLKKLQAGWRAEEARLRDKEAEALELAEEEQDELDAMWEDKTADLPAGGKKKGGKRGKKRVGEIDLKEEDPWEALQKSREQRKGLHDVAQAPPTFDRVPREIFKVKNGARVNVGNVPNAAGSLRKREELGEQRQTIIDTYRALMAARKEGN
jgi:hypothetical protein